MKTKKSKILLILIMTVLLFLTACTREAHESEPKVTNALETLEPGVYSENGNIDEYIASICQLGDYGPNPVDIDYPTMDHLLYIYLVDYRGNGNPCHSMLIDIKYKKGYYSTTSEFFTAAYGTQYYTEIDLSQTDIKTIITFQSLNGILDWKHYYSAEQGDTSWWLTLYFDDGSYFQSAGSYYPEEYEIFEEDIWPLLSEKTGEELWWMRGRI